MEQTNHQEIFAPGQVVTIYSDHLKQQRPEGKAKLIERVSTYSTKNDWQLASWKVTFVDDRDGGVYVRPVLEVGVPNKNVHVSEDYSKYGEAAREAARLEREAEQVENGTEPKTRRPRLSAEEKARREEEKRNKPKGKPGRKPMSEEEKAARAAAKAVIEGDTPKRKPGRPAMSAEEKAKREAEKGPKNPNATGKRGRPRKNPQGGGGTPQATPQVAKEPEAPKNLSIEAAVAAAEAVMPQFNPQLESARRILTMFGLGNTEITEDKAMEALEYMYAEGFDTEADRLFAGG